MINFSTGNIRKKGNITFKGYAIDIWLKNMKKSEKAFILLLRINLWVYVSFGLNIMAISNKKVCFF